MGYLYLIKAEDSETYKIGITKKSPEKRLKTLQTGNPEKLILCETYQSEHYRKMETHIHRVLKERRLEGEWFLLDDTFCFIKECKKAEEIADALSDNPFY